MTTTRARARQICAHCKKSQRRERLVYSRHTGRYYCIEERACNARAKRAAA